jgi:hypothetical protein
MRFDKCKTSGCKSAVAIKKAQQCNRCYSRQWWKDNPEAYAKQLERNRVYVRPVGLEFKAKKEVVGYSQAHKRLDLLRGKPNTHQCVACGNTAEEWALKDGVVTDLSEPCSNRSGCYLVAYSLDINDYEPRCRKCHRQMDLGKRAA